jgi:hypothetical protein
VYLPNQQEIRKANRREPTDLQYSPSLLPHRPKTTSKPLILGQRDNAQALAKLSDARIHDLRRTIKTYASQTGVNVLFGTRRLL